MVVLCLPDGVSSPRPQVVVVSTAEHWLSLKSLLQNGSGIRPQCTFTSLGSKQICELTVEHHSLRLHYAEPKQDTSEENIAQEIDGCFRSCKDGSCVFLLLIEGGFYSKRERRMIEILQAHFGAEALKFLVVLSLENLIVADTLDDSLMELINTCDGRYCRVSAVGAGEGLRPLFEMVDLTLVEHGGAGYSDAMLAEAKNRSTENSSMMILKQKVQEAEEKGQAFEQLVKFQEDRRAREMEALRVKHAEERKHEIAERKKHESKRESLEEAVVSHKAMLQRQMSEGTFLIINIHIFN
ncbi:unnamed protein product [Tetraodon nigroviridis]|uniref:(spotted green pufferfish) hypothetical protein n=1 Tax=Tetraodon nigroviridis TaxID=99883 RepID=Q4STH9_TETNG|nr:unnamed protein product [Tetraodon nigroviridis]CAF96053.1 unnamed protein product [Tetraodon nigroviridis]